MKTNKELPVCTTWGVMRRGDGRFTIIDASTEDILDDCQGCGFISYDFAYKYGYNKYHNKGQCNGVPNADKFNKLI